jgi:hypothetical protein
MDLFLDIDSLHIISLTKISQEPEYFYLACTETKKQKGKVFCVVSFIHLDEVFYC